MHRLSTCNYASALLLAVVVVFGYTTISNTYVSANSSSSVVVELTDDTFEHQTQASVGMTTGSWLVLFHMPNCNSCNKLKPVMEELSADEELHEQGIVLGSVDCSQNLSVCHRFSMTKLPVLLYLHQKQMYRYPLKREHTEFDNILVLPDTKKLKSYILRDYAAAATIGEEGGEGGQPIPNPASSIGILIKQIGDACEKNSLVGLAVYGMLLMILLTVFVLIATLVRSSYDKSSSQKKQTKTIKNHSKTKEE